MHAQDLPASSSSPFAALSLGQLARDLPGSTAVFRRHRLDFCCGGDMTLEAAAQARQLDLSAIERELSELSPQAQGDTPSDP